MTLSWTPRSKRLSIRPERPTPGRSATARFSCCRWRIASGFAPASAAARRSGRRLSSARRYKTFRAEFAERAEDSLRTARALREICFWSYQMKRQLCSLIVLLSACVFVAAKAPAGHGYFKITVVDEQTG